MSIDLKYFLTTGRFFSEQSRTKETNKKVRLCLKLYVHRLIENVVFANQKAWVL
jgi:hypothetical protein